MKQKYGHGKLREAMLAALSAPVDDVKALAAALEITEKNARNALSRFQKSGDVTLIDGRWIATSVADAAWKRAQLAARKPPTNGARNVTELLNVPTLGQSDATSPQQAARDALRVVLEDLEKQRTAIAAALEALG